MKSRNSSVLIIAEAGVNHNGNIRVAKKLCDAAKLAGANVIKFQTYKTESITTYEVAQARYQRENTGINETQFDMLKKLELSYDDFKEIKQYCDSIGITFASTGDTTEDLDFLCSIGIPFIKIGSGDIGNIPLLRYAGGKDKPIILSTGMSALSDIDTSVQALREGGALDITLLHCTTSYPCAFGNANLNAIHTIQKTFKVPVGYSDHTLGCTAAIAAVALGAKVIEKHFTLDKNMEGPDHKASMNPSEFSQLVKAIRDTEIAMGDGKKVPTQVEEEISKVVFKRIVAKKTIKEHQIITEQDICVKRSSTGLLCTMWDIVIGSKAKRDYAIDEGIEL